MTDKEKIEMLECENKQLKTLYGNLFDDAQRLMNHVTKLEEWKKQFEIRSKNGN